MFSFIKRQDRAARHVLYACFIMFFCSGTASLMMGSMMPDLRAAYGLNETVTGMFLSAHSVGNLVAGFLSGLVPLYLGEKRGIVVLTSLLVIGFAMLLVWGNPVWLFVGFVLTGLGRGSITNFDSRMVNRLSNGSPVATNLLHSCFAIGAILTPILFLAVSRVLGWRAGVSIVLVVTIPGIWNLSRMHLDNDRPDRRDKANKTLVFLKNPSFLILATMMLFYLSSEFAVNGWLVSYIQSKQELLAQLSATEGGLAAYSQTMATLLWTVMLVGRIGCAILSTRISPKKLMMFSCFGIVAFYGLLLKSDTLSMVTLSVAGLGLCMAGISPMIYSDAAVFTNTYPMATSMILVFGSTGAILMPTIVGALAQRFGFTGGMSAIFVTVTLLAVASVLNVVVKTRVPREAKNSVQG